MTKELQVLSWLLFTTSVFIIIIIIDFSEEEKERRKEGRREKEGEKTTAPSSSFSYCTGVNLKVGYGVGSGKAMCTFSMGGWLGVSSIL